MISYWARLGCDHINALYKFTITYLLTYLLDDTYKYQHVCNESRKLRNLFIAAIKCKRQSHNNNNNNNNNNKYKVGLLMLQDFQPPNSHQLWRYVTAVGL